ncbi:hypothetical protein V8J36_17210 [Frigidibacter sp. MR17.14]|uniref:hypothetical protein n=1 Tax=Frigidibacter sp. MR17.14 TaxID=3126509 RepID=UPI0030129EDF
MAAVTRLGMLGLAAAATLAACGPIPRADAERVCASRFQPTRALSGTVKAGVSNGNLSQGYELDFQPGVDFGDPNAGYTACVQRKSGEYPSRPLYQIGG